MKLISWWSRGKTDQALIFWAKLLNLELLVGMTRTGDRLPPERVTLLRRFIGQLRQHLVRSLHKRLHPIRIKPLLRHQRQIINMMANHTG
jgi:hypothetical protein